MGKHAQGSRGPLGHVGVIPVEKGSKIDFIKFAKSRLNDLLIEDLLKGGKEAEMYLLANIRYCFEDIHRAARKYLGVAREDE